MSQLVVPLLRAMIYLCWRLPGLANNHSEHSFTQRYGKFAEFILVHSSHYCFVTVLHCELIQTRFLYAHIQR